MKAAAHAHEFIDVQSLRVGMFVHLEGGWMSHPFPLSQFRIATVEQIATIRGLGLKQVRWDPQQSAITAANDDAAAEAAAPSAPVDTPAVAEAPGPGAGAD